MYDAIAALANERVLTAEDFTPFIGQSSWLTIDRADMSDHWLTRNPPISKLIADTYGFDEAVVTKFTVRTVHTNGNVVDILVDLGDPLSSTGTLMRLDADELAIRIEDS